MRVVICEDSAVEFSGLEAGLRIGGDEPTEEDMMGLRDEKSRVIRKDCFSCEGIEGVSMYDLTLPQHECYICVKAFMIRSYLCKEQHCPSPDGLR